VTTKNSCVTGDISAIFNIRTDLILLQLWLYNRAPMEYYRLHRIQKESWRITPTFGSWLALSHRGLRKDAEVLRWSGRMTWQSAPAHPHHAACRLQVRIEKENRQGRCVNGWIVVHGPC
jgi:hypothetical protein